MKYNFYTGENAKKVIYKGYNYLNKGKLGKIKSEKIDGQNVYYLMDYFNDFNRISPKTKDKTKFKKAQISDWKYKGKFLAESNYVEKQKAEKILTFKTQIKDDKKRFMRSVIINFGNDDYLLFHDLNESGIIKRLQLRDGDRLIVTFQKISQINDYSTHSGGKHGK